MIAEVTEDQLESMELKYCERCGNLWLRRRGDEEVYCENCVPRMAEQPRARVALKGSAENSAFSDEIGRHTSAVGEEMAFRWAGEAMRHWPDRNIFSQNRRRDLEAAEGEWEWTLDRCLAVSGEGGQA
jgi:hypothetical protein